MLPEVHIYIDRSEAETWNHDEIDNLQGKINTGEYSMSKVIIIGGGAAGMMAGVFAARNHHEVHILEKNEKLGKKVFITGKGRCNLTNACEAEDFFPEGQVEGIHEEDVGLAMDVRNAFFILSEEEQMIVGLSVFGGYNSTEIGKILSLKPGTVRVKRSRALEKMQCVLDGRTFYE